MDQAPRDQTLRFTAPAAAGRLDKFLTARSSLTRTWVQHLIAEGAATVNGRPVKAGYHLEPGDLVEARLLPPPTITLEPQAIPIEVVHQDEDLIVVDKPPRLTVHPAPGHPDHTLVNALLALCPDLASPAEGGAYLRPGIVHRLDKDTSGLMVVAKHPSAQESLARQLRDRTVTKDYLTLVEGDVTPDRGAIEAPIGRDPRRRDRMAVLERGRHARTRYQVEERLPRHTLVRATLETGRTHQVRVHFAAIGHPVTGDPVYGRAVPWCPRQFLHACRLGFKHPRSGDYVEYTSGVPEDLQSALDAARHLS